MGRKTWHVDNYWTFDDVKRKMVEHYVGSNASHILSEESRRKLGVTQTTDTCGSKIIYFTLNGSPPKGYATWLQSSRSLTLFDSHYNIWRKYYIQGEVQEK